MLAAPAQAAQYNVSNYFSLPSAATSDERVYQDDQGIISYERSGGMMAARTAPGVTNGPTVPASIIQGSDGFNQLFTLGASGLTDHGSLFNDPAYQQYDKTYNYDFITAPANPAVPVAADFLPANLTTPSPMLPAIVDTAVKTVFNRSYAMVDEFKGGAGFNNVQSAYVQETVTVDDNGGLLFDLTNPANPDYDPAFVAMWQTVNGGSGVAHLKGLLKMTIKDVSTGIGGSPVWLGNSTTVLYFASGIGVVYMSDSGPGWVSIRKLISYNLGAKAGAAAGLTSTQVKVQAPAGAALASSSVSLSGPLAWDPLAINPTTGQSTGANVPAYTSDAFVEQTQGSGIFKLYYLQGDLVDLTLRGAGYADLTATAQNLTALATASAPNPVPYTLTTPLGSITGKMLDAAGNPVANATVSLSKQTAGSVFGGIWTPPVVARTDINGNYSVQVDPAFSYTLAAGTLFGAQSQLPTGSLGGSVTQTGQVITNQAAQTPGSFSAASGATVVVNIQLVAGAIVSGKLTDTNGVAYTNAQVQLNDPVSGLYGFTTTDLTGAYAVTVAPGSYTIQVSPGFDPATGQPGQFPNGMASGYVDANGVLVQNATQARQFSLQPATPTIVNMQLLPGATVTGVLRDVNGVPYANATISLDTIPATGVGGSQTSPYATTTAANGSYSITVAPGSYTITVTEGWNPVANQPIPFPTGMMGGRADVAGALTWGGTGASFALLSGTTVVNMQLARGAVVSGLLTDTAGVPYGNASINLNDNVAMQFGYGMTDATGNYSVTVVPGSYMLQVSPGFDPATGQPGQFPNGMSGGYVDANGVLVQNATQARQFTLQPATPTIVNMQLIQGATISGTLLDANGAPYANAQIFLNSATGGSLVRTITDTNGNYSVVVTPGSYTVEVMPGWNSVTGQPQLFPTGMMGGLVDAAGLLTASMNAAQKFALAVGTTTTVNMQLVLGAVVSGTLTDANGVPFAYAQIQMNDAVTGITKSFIPIDSSGNYAATVVPGAYTLRVVEGWNDLTGQQQLFPSGMMGGFVNAAGSLVASGLAVKTFALAAGTTTTVNMQLTSGAVVNGILTDANGLPYANATIQFYDSGTAVRIKTSTNASGSYTVSLSPGTYTVEVQKGWNSVAGQWQQFPSGMTGGFVDVAGGLTVSINAAKGFILAAGATATVNMQLVSGAVVNGKVIDANGAPYANANIHFYESAMGLNAYAATDMSGNYTASLVPGTYTIEVAGGGQQQSFPSGMMGGFVDAAGLLTASMNAAQKFALAVGTTATVNMQLVVGAVLSGTLTDANGVPYASAQIQLNAPISGLFAFSTTDVGGNYTMTVAPGSYTVAVSGKWNNATGQQQALPNGLTAGYVDATGILVPNAAQAKVFNLQVAVPTVINVNLSAQVVDTVAPVVSPPPNVTFAATSLSGIAASDPNLGAVFLAAGTATDNVGVVGGVNAGAVGGGILPAVFPVGVTIVQFNAVDAAGNVGTGTATVTVSPYVAADTTPPVITMLGQSPVTVTQGTVYNDAGATAVDNVDGDLTTSIAVASTVNTSTIGSYTVSYDVSDAAGNAAAQVTRTVNVVAAATAAPAVSAGVSSTTIQPGGATNLAIAITPAGGAQVSSFNIGIVLDGSNLTATNALAGDLPVGWTVTTTISPPQPNGLVQVSMIGQQNAGAVLTQAATIQLPVTAVAGAANGTALGIVFDTVNSGLFAAGGTKFAATFQNGTLTVVANISQTYNLTGGWNLISFPMDLGATGLTDFLTAVPAATSIWTFVNGGWQSFVVGTPAFLNSLKQLTPGNGYWVQLPAGVTKTVTLSAPPVTVTANLVAASGWNLIGVTTPVTDMAGFITSSGAASVWAFSNGQWQSFIAGTPVFLNSLQKMDVGIGYYVNMK